MSDLDEMERLARAVQDVALPGEAEQLARALLAVLPVVRAAGAWADACVKVHDANEPTQLALAHAIVTLRATLRGGG